MVNLAGLNPFGYTVSASSEIADLRVYPIKSCRGISIRSTTIGPRGLDLDRNWMFVCKTKDDKLEFQTIRSISELTLVDTALVSSKDSEGNGSEDDLELVISLRGQPSKYVSIPARPTAEWLAANTELCTVSIWGADTDGYVYGESVNKLIADFLGRPVQLVYKGPEQRLAGGEAGAAYFGHDVALNFPDMMPVLVANLTSIAELNQRLAKAGEKAITIERFRPNVILKGGEETNMGPWSEDSWKTLRLLNGRPQSGWLASGYDSTLELNVDMRCARCQVPNVDPETAIKHKKQPWDTLVSYRRIDEGHKFKPCFGMLCTPRSSGPIRVGMKMEVVETTQNHKIPKW